MSRLPRLSFALLVLFVISGFAGLIYQSVWSQYLGLTLGHAAYAQTLVLAIFMGGMALGAWLASRYSPHWRRLILWYAVAEGVIGLLGLVFHPLFVAYTGLSQDTVLPALSSPGVAHAYQWLSAGLLIAPQSILLGTTFPLMSAGLMRALPDQDGEVLGGLYFSNSLGAALGALLATFVLLPAMGLPGTVVIAGLLNLLVAAGAWGLGTLLDKEQIKLTPMPARGSASAANADSTDDVRRLGRVLMTATAISGAASFVYEVGWVRLLNQALGTTIHSFELMLAAFILGLAFGGLWIRKRARNISESVRYVGYVQVLMGIAALISIPVFTQSFTWVGWMMAALSRSDEGYTLFQLGTAGISLLVMFPAAFLAGMTLPLFTLSLLRAGAGERAVGRIYAANTLGAIVGVTLAMHVLIPVIGVQLAVTLAALVDALVGLYLLRAINPARFNARVALAAFGTLAAVMFSVMLGRVDSIAQISGVFRTGVARLPGAKVNYVRDGKTATVSVFTNGGMMVISTNGKPDAGLTGFNAPPSPDEPTMIMAGLAPLKLHPNPKEVAIIGWGSGLTTHTVLGSSIPDTVTTIEIERVMHDAARLFGKRVERAYNDPRSRLQIDDARTFFSTGARRYDVIISEPSNPWVSGVASLFTREFYGFLKHHLNKDGMLVQWLHTYELDDPLVATMLAAMLSEFPNAELYVTNSVDLLIIARKNPKAPQTSTPWRAEGNLREELERAGLAKADDFPSRRIGGKEVMTTFVRLSASSAHSDYYPTVSLQAPRTRFLQTQSDLLRDLVINGMPVLDVLECRKPFGRSAAISFAPTAAYSLWRQNGLDVVDGLATGNPYIGRTEPLARPIEVAAVLDFSKGLADTRDVRVWTEPVAHMARSTIGILPAEDLQQVWVRPNWLPPQAMAVPEVRAIMAAYSAAARRSPKEMRATAEAALGLPTQIMSMQMREQMIVIAMLGALGTGDPSAVSKIDERWGSSVDIGELFRIRSYLLAWADGPAPACMSRAMASEPAVKRH